MATRPVIIQHSFAHRCATWLRENLFSTPGNTLTTLLTLGLLAWLGSHFFAWAVLDAVWGRAPVAACNAAGGHGACWAVVANKWRQMLFGIYPQEQQWRPALAVLLFCGILVVSAMRAFWTMRRIAAVWGVGSLLCFWLMAGGLGLTPVPTSLWGGLPITLMLAVFGTLLAFPLGVLLALGRRSELPIVRAVSIAYIELIRGVPLITVLFMASIMFALFLPEGVTFDKLLRAMIGISLFGAAYMAEVVRGGLQAIPKGQYEGAMSLGIGYWKMMVFIVLPQALRIVIPGIVNNFISLFKDTTLVAIVGIFDLIRTIEASRVDPVWAAPTISYTGYAFAGLFYFLCCWGMSRYSLAMERRLAAGQRR